MLEVIAEFNGTRTTRTFAKDDVELLYVNAMNGNDEIIMNTDLNSYILCGGGDDQVLGSSGEDTVFGGSGSDRISGRDGDDTIRLGTGDDFGFGNAGDDTIIGANGDDLLNGGEGNDLLLGGNNDDTLFGLGGNDFLAGGNGDDTLVGHSGKNILAGQSGADRVSGTFPRDTLREGTDEGDQTITTYLVDNNSDVTDGDFSTGNLTLREAVSLSNDDDIIRFTRLAAAGPATIGLTQGEISIEHDLKFFGDPRNRITIDGNQAGRIFNVAANATAFIARLDLTSGRAEGGIQNGGAMFVSGTATLRLSNVFSNQAAFRGGGIYVDEGGKLTVSESTVRDNTTFDSGGGIYNNSGVVNVISSTLSGNEATDDVGGGYAQETTGSELFMVNSTVSGNTSSFQAGINLFGGSAKITNSTIAFNQSTLVGFGGAGLGSTLSDIEVSNSLIIGNTAAAAANDLSERGPNDTWFNNLVGQTFNSDLTNGIQGNIVGAAAANVLSNTLADNGGNTLTHALVFESEAQDKGSNEKAVDPRTGSALAIDQTGSTRIVGDAVDIGSYET